MTHDELLALLNAKSDSNEVHALRAIAELHKPNGYHFANVCDVCDAIYPCPTIKAIEEEVK